MVEVAFVIMSRKSRWLASWRNSAERPIFFHIVSRVVERRFAFGPEEKEKFRTLMRMQEKFTGCRVVSYCLMCNHFHLLLEVPPMAEGGLSNEGLLKRLTSIYSEAFVAGVAKELLDARSADYVAKAGMDEALIGVENFNEKSDRDTPPFASEEAACRFSSQMEVSFQILLKCLKIGP